MYDKVNKVLQFFEHSRYFKRFGLHARLPQKQVLTGIASKETVTKEEIDKMYSNASHEFSEIDLSDDETHLIRKKRKISKSQKKQ